MGTSGGNASNAVAFLIVDVSAFEDRLAHLAELEANHPFQPTLGGERLDRRIASVVEMLSGRGLDHEAALAACAAVRYLTDDEIAAAWRRAGHELIQALNVETFERVVEACAFCCTDEPGSRVSSSRSEMFLRFLPT